MASTAEDTDTLLAILSSLLPNAKSTPDHATLLDALVRANGDVQVAVNLLSSPKPQSRGRKRKGLDSWLQQEVPLAKASRARTSSPEKRQALIQPAASSSRKPISSSAIVNRGSSSPSKSTVNAFDMLKPQSSTKPPSVARLPPLTLSNPKMVAEHTPCTLHLSVLPPELACELFYTMLHEARDWSRNKWYMFDRLVESPHRTAFYTRSGDGESDETRALHRVAQQWYNGRKQGDDAPRVFPKSVEKACTIIEDIVNKEMLKRTQFPLEWGGVHPSTGGDKALCL